MKALKRINNILLITCLIMFLALPGFAFAKVQLKFAHENNTSSAIQLQVEIFKKLVEERTHGEVEIAIFPGGTLTSSPEELIEFLREGAVDFSLTSTGNVSGFLDDLQFINLPFLFKNPQHLKAGLQSYPPS